MQTVAPVMHAKAHPQGKVAVVSNGRIRYVDRADYLPPEEIKPKPERQSKPRIKNDPRHIAAARELRDRFLEQINSARPRLAGKYNIARAIKAQGKSKRMSLSEIRAALPLTPQAA